MSDELVAENLLTISKVVDRNNVSVINRTTYETAIKVTGINAEPKNKVWIMNGNDTLGEATTDDVGGWDSLLLDLKNFDCYNVRAVGQWSPNPSSLPRRFTAATATPIINEVLSDGKPIADNETIRATEVTFHVNAIPSQDARVFNGEILLKTEPANTCGKCTIVLTDLEPATYRITVKAPNNNESTAFNFTVVEDVTTPVTLDKVTTPAGAEVPDGTTTPETSLFVEGEGEKGAKVEVFKNGLTLGDSDVDATTGRYKHSTGLLAEDTYAFTVTAMYAGGGDAGPYTITVEAATIEPKETRIYDAEGNVIPNGGDISKSWLIARGLHTPNSAVKIKVNGVIQPKQEPTNDEGKWAFLLNSLIVGTTYTISALTLDEKGESNPWSVVARPPS
jgi:hypothetical protein